MSQHGSRGGDRPALRSQIVAETEDVGRRRVAGELVTCRPDGAQHAQPRARLAGPALPGLAAREDVRASQGSDLAALEQEADLLVGQTGEAAGLDLGRLDELA